jgi:hypothetical protein
LRFRFLLLICAMRLMRLLRFLPFVLRGWI